MRLGHLVTAVIVFCCHSVLAAADIDQGLQGFWGFEEGVGTTSVDDSTYDHDALLINAPAWAVGKIASSLYFNGESSFVDLGNNERFAFRENVTLAAWVKLNNPNYAAYTRIISKKYNWSDAAGYELEYNAATNRLALIGGGTDVAYALNVDLDTNWHHVVASVSGNLVQLYVDGQAVPMTDAHVGTLQAGDAPLTVGRNSSAAAPFIGCIDEVRIYDEALSAEAVAALAWTGIGQRVVQWSGYNWLVKNAAVMGPGPNAWNDSSDAVWVDEQGQLHLKIKKVNGAWQCAEVVSKKVMGYGSYATTLASSLEQIDPQMVLGVFVYKDDFHEVDVEYSAWGNAELNAHRQFVVQPYYAHGHMHEMHGTQDTAGLNYQIDWLSESISCTAGADDWYFAEDYVAVQNPHMHLNLWLFQGQEPQGQTEFEVVFADFTFTPESALERDAEPLIHWEMQEGAGAVVADLGALNLDGILSDAKWQNNVERDNYLYFDGSQDAVVVPQESGLDLVGNKTVSLWMRNDRPNKRLYQRLLSQKNNWTDATGFEVVYHPQRNEIQLVGQGNRVAYAQGIDLDTEWHHVAITIIGTRAQIYVDGAAQPMTRNDVGSIQASALDLYMGRMAGGYGDFKGGLDDVRIYDQVLSTDEINDIYVEAVLVAN